MHLLRFWVVAFFALLGTAPAFALNVCEFDELLMNGFVDIYPNNANAVHKLLYGIAQVDGHVEPGECEGNRLRGLQRNAASFLKLNGEQVKFLKYDSAGIEDEEVALLNLLFEYVVAKYNSAYSYAKNHRPKAKTDIENLIQLLSELADISYSVLWAKFKNPTVVGVVGGLASNVLPSWLYLWIRSDNPFKHDAYYDFDYSWLLIKRDVYLKSFPDSKYGESVNALVNEESVGKMLQRDRNRLNFHFGMTYVIGKSLFNSTFSDVDEKFAFGSQGRIQIYSALILLQVDGIYGDDIMWGGLGLFGGYALIDKEKFGVDILGGISVVDETITYYDEDYLEENEVKNSFFAFAAGVQVFKRFPIGDMFDAVPKVQWMIQVAPAYFNELTNREGVGVMNRFYIGIGFDGKVPMGAPRK